MDDVRGPALFLHGIQNAAGEENGAFSIVFEELAAIVPVDLLAAEIIFVVDEIYLDAGGRDGGHLDHEGTVYVGDDDIHPREADHFVKLVLASVDAAVQGHEGADFLVTLLDSLGEFTADIGHGALRQIGVHLRIHKQDLLGGISHITFF